MRDYVIRVKRGDWDSIVKIGSLSACRRVAESMNSLYSTDAYRVELFDPRRWSRSGAAE